MLNSLQGSGPKIQKKDEEQAVAYGASFDVEKIQQNRLPYSFFGKRRRCNRQKWPLLVKPQYPLGRSMPKVGPQI